MVEGNEGRQQRLRELLLEQKRKEWAELREEIFRRNSEDINAQFDIPQDNGEQSLIDLLKDTNLALADVRQQSLTRLDEAMARLERGEYGVCASCGAEIDERRMAVEPYAVYCVNCQKEQEKNLPPKATL